MSWTSAATCSFERRPLGRPGSVQPGKACSDLVLSSHVSAQMMPVILVQTYTTGSWTISLDL